MMICLKSSVWYESSPNGRFMALGLAQYHYIHAVMMGIQPAEMMEDMEDGIEATNIGTDR